KKIDNKYLEKFSSFVEEIDYIPTASDFDVQVKVINKNGTVSESGDSFEVYTPERRDENNVAAKTFGSRARQVPVIKSLSPSGELIDADGDYTRFTATLEDYADVTGVEFYLDSVKRNEYIHSNNGSYYIDIANVSLEEEHAFKFIALYDTGSEIKSVDQETKFIIAPFFLSFTDASGAAVTEHVSANMFKNTYFYLDNVLRVKRSDRNYSASLSDYSYRISAEIIKGEDLLSYNYSPYYAFSANRVGEAEIKYTIDKGLASEKSVTLTLNISLIGLNFVDKSSQPLTGDVSLSVFKGETIYSGDLNIRIVQDDYYYPYALDNFQDKSRLTAEIIKGEDLLETSGATNYFSAIGTGEAAIKYTLDKWLGAEQSVTLNIDITLAPLSFSDYEGNPVTDAIKIDASKGDWVNLNYLGQDGLFIKDRWGSLTNLSGYSYRDRLSAEIISGGEFIEADQNYFGNYKALDKGETEIKFTIDKGLPSESSATIIISVGVSKIIFTDAYETPVTGPLFADVTVGESFDISSVILAQREDLDYATSLYAYEDRITVTVDSGAGVIEAEDDNGLRTYKTLGTGEAKLTFTADKGFVTESSAEINVRVLSFADMPGFTFKTPVSAEESDFQIFISYGKGNVDYDGYHKVVATDDENTFKIIFGFENYPLDNYTVTLFKGNTLYAAKLKNNTGDPAFDLTADASSHANLKINTDGGITVSSLSLHNSDFEMWADDYSNEGVNLPKGLYDSVYVSYYLLGSRYSHALNDFNLQKDFVLNMDLSLQSAAFEWDTKIYGDSANIYINGSTDAGEYQYFRLSDYKSGRAFDIPKGQYTFQATFDNGVYSYQINGEFKSDKAKIDIGSAFSGKVTDAYSTGGSTYQGESNFSFRLSDLTDAYGNKLYYASSASDAFEVNLQLTDTKNSKNIITLTDATKKSVTPNSTVFGVKLPDADGEFKLSAAVNSNILTVLATAGGTITKGVSGPYDGGSSIELSAQPNNGYVFTGWSSSNGGSFTNPSSASASFIMPKNSTTVTAHFAIKSTSSGGGGGSSGGGGGGGGAPIASVVTTDQKKEPAVVKNPAAKEPVIEKPAVKTSDTVILYIGDATYSVNGEKKTMDSPPFITNGRTMVPVRFIAEAFGANVGWEDAEKKVTVKLEDKTLSFVIGQLSSGLDTPPIIVNDRAFAPIRYVAEAFDANVVWHEDTKSVEITKSTKTSAR
ncbi:MAG: hypothetical protein LBL35_03470, partial [Clostridiales bacterium]|nr:hypothetical protein [Clostridiales bacterium]